MRLNRNIESASSAVKQAMERAEELHDPKLGKKLADIWSLMLEADAMAWKLAQEESEGE